MSKPSKSRILVVDDDVDLGRFVVDIASDHGYEALHVPDGDAALRSHRDGSFDLIITDVRMPGLDGIQLIERIRTVDAHVAIIAITAFGSVETGMRALHAGAFDYLSKPFRSDELSTRMQRALDRRARELETARLRREVDAVLRRSKP